MNKSVGILVSYVNPVISKEREKLCGEKMDKFNKLRKSVIIKEWEKLCRKKKGKFDIEDYKKNVIMDAAELEEKVKRLWILIYSDVFKTIKPFERAQIKRQVDAMVTYLNILNERISRYGL